LDDISDNSDNKYDSEDDDYLMIKSLIMSAHKDIKEWLQAQGLSELIPMISGSKIKTVDELRRMSD